MGKKKWAKILFVILKKINDNVIKVMKLFMFLSRNSCQYYN